VTPAHTELELNTFAALNTAVDSQRLAGSVKSAAREAFYHAKPAIQTVKHSFNECVSIGLRNVPEADFITDTRPSTSM
jgi:hypothetical protein